MKNYSYTFSIDKPCSEAWDKMTSSEKGRFCMNCQHEVIDFSTLRDDEIIRVIENAKGNVCGRFRNSQLSRPMHLSIYVKRPSSLRAIIAGIVLLTLVTPLVSEAGDVSVQVESKTVLSESKNSERTLPSDSIFYLYKGRVQGIVGNSRLEDVKVFLADSSQMVVTDSNGNFEIFIPARLAKTTYIIKIVDDLSVYEPNEVIVDGASLDYNTVHTVYLLPSEGYTMGKVISPYELPAKPTKPKKNK